MLMLYSILVNLTLVKMKIKTRMTSVPGRSLQWQHKLKSRSRPKLMLGKRLLKFRNREVQRQIKGTNLKILDKKRLKLLKNLKCILLIKSLILTKLSQNQSKKFVLKMILISLSNKKNKLKKINKSKSLKI